ncbi:MAG: TonB C-terminal domain-containing protein [Sulfurimonas sp.]|nr:TonB C-terminal domain-containing protein [Sulfurimonas sp.]
MNKEKYYFYVSGFISLSLFFFFLIISLYMLVSTDKTHIFAIKKDNFISVSIEIPEIMTRSIKKNKPKEVVEKTITPIKSKDINIDNLFNDVWTKSIKKSKRVEEKVNNNNNRRLQEIQKKISKSNENKVKLISKKINTNDVLKVSDKTVKTSTAHEVNEYLAKIQALVYEHFFPPQNTQGNSVKAIIELSSLGKMYDFRILTYSSNSELNKECDKIKKRLINIIFPKKPSSSFGPYTIILKSKE